MCGRMNVVDDPLCEIVSEQLGIQFNTKTNRDLRPTQEVAAVAAPEGELQQLDTTWGIKPRWATQTLINAKAETVREKQTFAGAFGKRRCLVPCSGYYEWRQEAKGKRKYLFRHSDDKPFYMAAIWYPGDDGAPQIVTLTREATMELRAFHHRMPVLILPEHARDYVLADPDQAASLLMEQGGRHIMPEPAD